MSKCKSRMSNQVIKFWTANPDACFREFYDYLKEIWHHGPPSMNSLGSVLSKCGLLEVSGSKRVKTFSGGTHEVKTWKLRNKNVVDREV
jgi:hypothetical protein